MMQDWEREMYLLHAGSKAYKKHKEEATQIIKKAISEHPGKWALSYSGGKDSTVLLDVAVKAGWEGPLCYFYYSEYENPSENLDMAKYAEDKYNLDLHIIDLPSEFDIYREIGHFFIIPQTKEEKAAISRYNRMYKKQINEYTKKHCWVGQIIGMRKGESNKRLMTLARNGPIYFAKTRELMTCCPLYNWTADDVWAYIVENDLPYLKIYDVEGYDRRKVRNELTFFVVGNSWVKGLWEQYKTFYPQICNKIKKEFPQFDTWRR